MSDDRNQVNTNTNRIRVLELQMQALLTGLQSIIANLQDYKDEDDTDVRGLMVNPPSLMEINNE